MSGTGGVAGRSFASAMMCSKVMSVWVQTSVTCASGGVPSAPARTGGRRRTWATMGSRRMASRLMASATVPSWSTLENSRVFTCRREKSSFLNPIIYTSNDDKLGKWAVREREMGTDLLIAPLGLSSRRGNGASEELSLMSARIHSQVLRHNYIKLSMPSSFSDLGLIFAIDFRRVFRQAGIWNDSGGNGAVFISLVDSVSKLDIMRRLVFFCCKLGKTNLKRLLLELTFRLLSPPQ